MQSSYLKLFSSFHILLLSYIKQDEGNITPRTKFALLLKQNSAENSIFCPVDYEVFSLPGKNNTYSQFCMIPRNCPFQYFQVVISLASDNFFTCVYWPGLSWRLRRYPQQIWSSLSTVLTSLILWLMNFVLPGLSNRSTQFRGLTRIPCIAPPF